MKLSKRLRIAAAHIRAGYALREEIKKQYKRKRTA